MRQSIIFIFLIFLTLPLAACASATPLPPLPTRVFTPTFTPTSPPPPATPIATTVPPTSTPPPSPTMPAATPTPAPPTATPEFPPIPRGMGGLIVVNNLGQELAYDIGNNLYRIPPKSKLIIFLSPGRHNFSATVPGYNGKTGTAEIREGFYHQQLWG